MWVCMKFRWNVNLHRISTEISTEFAPNLHRICTEFTWNVGLHGIHMECEFTQSLQNLHIIYTSFTHNLHGMWFTWNLHGMWIYTEFAKNSQYLRRIHTEVAQTWHEICAELTWMWAKFTTLPTSTRHSSRYAGGADVCTPPPPHRLRPLWPARVLRVLNACHLAALGGGGIMAAVIGGARPGGRSGGGGENLKGTHNRSCKTIRSSLWNMILS
jgi:hypothetical protein